MNSTFNCDTAPALTFVSDQNVAISTADPTSRSIDSVMLSKSFIGIVRWAFPVALQDLRHQERRTLEQPLQAENDISGRRASFIVTVENDTGQPSTSN